MSSISAFRSHRSPFKLLCIFSTDYRRLPRTLSHVYYDPLDERTRLEFTKLFHAFTHISSDDPLVHNRTLTTWGREIRVPQSTSQVAKWKFEELCGRALSAADYLEITRNFGTIFVEDVPKMGMNQKDMARRFITFIDGVYFAAARCVSR